MKQFLYKLAGFLLISLSVALAPFQAGYCDDCSNLDEPCSADEAVGKCCETYTNDQNETRKLKCNDTDSICVDDGPKEE